MTSWVTLRWFLGVELDEVINTQDGDGGLGGELETFDLADGGFKNATSFVVSYHSLDQVKTNPKNTNETTDLKSINEHKHYPLGTLLSSNFYTLCSCYFIYNSIIIIIKKKKKKKKIIIA